MAGRKKKAKEPGPPEQVGYEAEDLAAINTELDEQEELLEAAKQDFKKNCKEIKARAKADLNIPVSALNSSRAAAKIFDRQKAVFDAVPPALTEIFLDMFKARIGVLADTPLGEAAIKAAEESVDSRRAAMERSEQDEGERVLERAH